MTQKELLEIMPKEKDEAEVVAVTNELVKLRLTCPCCGKVLEIEIPQKGGRR